MVEELSGRQWAGNTGLQVRLLCAALMGMCANRAGSLSRKQVIRKGLGVRIPPSPLLSRFGRIGKCTCLLSRGRLVRHPGSGPGSGAHYNNGRYANWMKQAVCKTVALGLAGSSPALCRLYAVVPQMVEELPAKQLVGYTGLQVQVLCAALIIISACAATGRQAGLRSQRP